MELIYAQLYAYAEDDPRPGYDLVMQAETGFMSMNGQPDGAPAKMPVAMIDLMAAHQLKEAILIALLKRERNAAGSLIEVSLYQSAIASNEALQAEFCKRAYSEIEQLLRSQSIPFCRVLSLDRVFTEKLAKDMILNHVIEGDAVKSVSQIAFTIS